MSYWRGQETKKVVVQPWLDKRFYNKSRKNSKEFRREKFEQLNCRNKWERMKGKKKKTNPKQILSQFMCTIKSNWHKPNPWGGTFALLTKKKIKTRSWNYKLRSTPARFMTLLIIILSLPLLLCCLSFSLELLHLVESREKGAKEERTTREVWHFSAANNNKINYRQHSAGLQGSKEKRQRSHC